MFSLKLVIMFLLVLLVVVFLLQAVAFSTLCERHLLGGSQSRLGPNKSSFMGLIQSVFDGVKLIKKEQVFSLHSSNFFFVFMPGFTYTVMCLEWLVVKYVCDFFTFSFSILFLLCLIGFSVYSFLMSGIFSKSKYGLLGSLRASSQSVSYEIIFSVYVICMVIFGGGYEFVVGGGCLFLFFWLPYVVLMLGELNRAPFDFSEGESELVSGYNVEFGSITYVLFYIGEYGSLLFFSLLFSLLFFFSSILVFFVVFVFVVFVRSSFPRFRYDMMMWLFWLVLLPLSFFYLLGCLLMVL